MIRSSPFEKLTDDDYMVVIVWLLASLNITRLILGLRPANEERCYFVTTSLIGWAQA